MSAACFFRSFNDFLLNDQKIVNFVLPPFIQSRKYPKTKKLRTLLNYFGDMTEMSRPQKTVFRRGCESDKVERVQHVMPQAGANEID